MIIIHVVVAYGYRRIGDELKRHRVDSRLLMKSGSTDGVDAKKSKYNQRINFKLFSGPGLVKKHCRLLLDFINKESLMSFERALIVSDNAASVIRINFQLTTIFS